MDAVDAVDAVRAAAALFLDAPPGANDPVVLRARAPRQDVVVAALIIASTFAIAIGATGCSPDFLPSSFVNEPRVLAITADPPEATPGQTVTLTPTVVDVTGDLTAASSGAPDSFTAAWWRCPDSDSDALGDYDQCTDPSTRATIGSAVPFVDTVPADLFGDLTQPPSSSSSSSSSSPSSSSSSAASQLSSDKILGAILGYWRVVGMTMTTSTQTIDGFKREPVFLPGHLGDIDPKLAPLDAHVDDAGNDVPPNENPTLSAVSIHEGSVDGGTTTHLSKSKTYFFVPVYDERAIDAYVSLKVDLTGLDLSDAASIKSIPIDDLVHRFSKVQRCEIPTFSWFITAGTLERDNTLDEGVVARVFDPKGVDCPPIEGDVRRPEVKYTPPTNATADPQDRIPKDGVVHAWVVMRDGRGGTAVRSFDFSVE